MASVISHIIDPDNGGGTDYISLNAWEVAQQRDLPAADEIAQANCRASSGSADTTVVDLVGWTTDATRYIEIKGERLGSAELDVSKYRLSTIDETALAVRENFVRVDAFQLTLSFSSSDTYIACINHTALDVGNELRISNSILKGNAGVGTVKYIGIINNTNAIIKIWNTIIYDFPRRGIEFSGSTCHCYNIVIEGATSVDGFKQLSGTMTCINCVSFNNADDFDSVSNIDYCASDDGDGDHPVTPSDWSTVFEDWANEDFSLKSTDTDLKDAGISDPGSGLFSDDIAGDTRSGIWDIGADEYVLGGVIVTPPPISAIAAGVDPTVINNVLLQNLIASSIGRSIDPTVILGDTTVSNAIASAITNQQPPNIINFVTLTPTLASAVVATIDPTAVLGDVLITNQIAAALCGVIEPFVGMSSMIVIPDIAVAIARTIDPTTVLNSLTISNIIADAIARGVDPTTHQGSITIVNEISTAIAAVVVPGTILGSITIQNAIAEAIATVVDPTLLEQGITISNEIATALAGTVNPYVDLGAVTISSEIASTITSSANPAVALGSIIIANEIATAIASVIDPNVVFPSVLISNALATVIAAAVDPAPILGNITVANAIATALAEMVDPTVGLSSILISGEIATVLAKTVDPYTFQSSITIANAIADAVCDVVGPEVTGIHTTIVNAIAAAVATVVDPTARIYPDLLLNIAIAIADRLNTEINIEDLADTGVVIRSATEIDINIKN